MGTKANPGDFDCYANAALDEPMFILLARDAHAALLVRIWATLRDLAGEAREKISEARDCADAMDIWRKHSGRDDVAALEALATLIAGEIVRQLGNDVVDNLGDGESLLLCGMSPAINVVEIAEALVERKFAISVSAEDDAP
jgi:hypothetical protein